MTPSRRMWRALEAYHGMIYFVPEADAEYTALGLDAGMMGYFASRAAPMGAVPADVVVATFYNFEPTRVQRLVPEAWRRTRPAALVQARLRAADRALRRMLGARLDQPDIAQAAAALRRALDVCRPEGRPLFAGHASLDWPHEPHLALWHAVTLLREYRGDGHVAALTVEGVGGCEALVLHGATGAVAPAVLRSTRGWSDDAWAAAVDAVRERGWLDDAGALTEAGAAHRQRIEDLTDELASAPWRSIGDATCASIAALGKELSAAIAAAGTFG